MNKIKVYDHLTKREVRDEMFISTKTGKIAHSRPQDFEIIGETMKTKLYIAKETPDAVINSKPHAHDAGIDLTATETVVIPAKGTALVPIGMRVTCEEGWWYTIHPRSSLAFKHSVTPMPGSVFDAGFTGDMSIKMLNLSDNDYVISKGDRFAQIIIHRVNEFEIIEKTVEELEEMFSDKRGNNCWGSSGK